MMAQYTNTSLERGMSILNTLGDAEEPMMLTEVAARVGLARSTCFRLMAVLQDLGFVLKNPDTSTYSLGFNAYRLGQTTHAVEAIVRDARPFLVKLTQQTGLTSYLGALEGPQLLICDVAVPQRTEKAPVSTRMRIDAHAVAAGKMLLATRPEDEVAAFFATHPPRRYTHKTLNAYDRLRQELREVSASGYAIERGEMREDVEALSIPVISSFERPILALATIGKVPKDGSVRFQRRIDAMRAAINELYEFRVFGR
jgi:DNA-binding IclR family transcriptional regulator